MGNESNDHNNPDAITMAVLQKDESVSPSLVYLRAFCKSSFFLVLSFVSVGYVLHTACYPEDLFPIFCIVV